MGLYEKGIEQLRFCTKKRLYLVTGSYVTKLPEITRPDSF